MFKRQGGRPGHGRATLEQELRHAKEIVPGRLAYVALSAAPPVVTDRRHQRHFFCIDQELVYWNFYLDFGPLNLGQLYRFSQKLNGKLASEALKDYQIFFYSSSHAQRRANATMLMAAWSLIYMNLNADEAWAPFADGRPKLPPFHDASPCVCTFRLTVPDCLRGLEKALVFGFFSFDDFDVEEYEYYESVEYGDLNWIMRRKFLAFAGPHEAGGTCPDGYKTLAPSDYIPYFQKNHVSLVVRLNKKYYSRDHFIRAGIDHTDMYYLDGSCPPPAILQRFLTAAEATPGAVAVHCKAGLGRTGTCIGCYMMKHYRMTAAEVIGWIRICRPGSIIGPQQHFLEEAQAEMWRLGDAHRRAHGPAEGFDPALLGERYNERYTEGLAGDMDRMSLEDGERSRPAGPLREEVKDPESADGFAGSGSVIQGSTQGDNLRSRRASAAGLKHAAPGTVTNAFGHTSVVLV